MQKKLLCASRLLGLITFLGLLGGCKKDEITQKADPRLTAIIQTYLSGPKVQDISISTFLEKINLNSLGPLKNSFGKISPEKLMNVQGPTGTSQLNDFILETDNIKLLDIEGVQSYVFSVKQNSYKRKEFQNVTIEKRGEKVFAFLSTYIPTTTWVEKYKVNKYEPFDGQIIFSKIDLTNQTLPSLDVKSILKVEKFSSLGAVPKSSQSVTVCSSYTVIKQAPYICAASMHMPWDYCDFADKGQPEKMPGFRSFQAEQSSCSEIQIDGPPNPGGGTGGGGGNDGTTTPNYPGGYQPCSPCDTFVGGSTDAANYLSLLVNINDAARSSYVNSNVDITGSLIDYIEFHNKSAQSKEFIGRLLYKVSALSNVGKAKLKPLLQADLTNVNTFEQQNEFITLLDLNLQVDDLAVEMNSPTFNYLVFPWVPKLIQFHNTLVTLIHLTSTALKVAVLNDIKIRARLGMIGLSEHLYPSLANGNVSEGQKQIDFLSDATKTVAILLNEFANGTGENSRTFAANSPFTQKYLEGGNAVKLKNVFWNKLAELNLTYDSFVTNGAKVDGAMVFSPDHAGVWNSFWAHTNADLTRLFIGGANVSFLPTNQDGWLQVNVSNDTSLRSLMAHTGNNIDRVAGQTSHPPLSTIKQDLIFYINILQ